MSGFTLHSTKLFSSLVVVSRNKIKLCPISSISNGSTYLPSVQMSRVSHRNTE